MITVSFEVAKTLKEFGYPQNENVVYRTSGETYTYESWMDFVTDEVCVAPDVLEVWRWLWEDKNIKIVVDVAQCSVWINNNKLEGYFDVNENPEKSIESVIEYLVKENLLK